METNSEISPLQSLESQIKELEDNTDDESFQKRYKARKELSKINKSAPKNPILDELKLIYKQEQKNADALPVLSDQRINLYTKLQQMTNNLSKEKSLTKARETELVNLQKKLTRTTDLNNSLSDSKSPDSTAIFKKNIDILTDQINKIQIQLGHPDKIITPEKPSILKKFGFTNKKPSFTHRP